MARRKVTLRSVEDERRRRLEDIRGIDYWSVYDFARAVIGCSHTEIYRRMRTPGGTDRPDGRCLSAEVVLPDGLRVPCHRDLNGHWRIARWQYEAAKTAARQQHEART